MTQADVIYIVVAEDRVGHSDRRVVAAFRTEQAAYELVKAIRDPLDVTPIREMEKGGRTSTPALLHCCLACGPRRRCAAST